MKLRVTIFLLFVAASTAMAAFFGPFQSWDDLTMKSPDIIIARCTATTPDPILIVDGMIWSDIETVLALKGDTKPGKGRMVSEYRPRQGERFLMFSTFQDKTYSATEKYRIVPLDNYFSTNELTGKSLNAQIRLILRNRLDELERSAEEKKRLEEGLKK